MFLVAFISYKKASTLDGFLLGNRGFGGWMSAFSYGTSYFSAVVFIGYAGKYGMSMGLAAIFIGVANAIIGSLFAWILLAKRTRDLSITLDAKTVPEMFEKRYDSKYLKLISAIIIFILLIPYSTAVYQGIAYLFEAVFGIPFLWCIVLIAALVGIYLFIGGYFANAVSSFIQGIIMIIGVVAMLIFMFNTQEVDGLNGIKKLLSSGYGFIPSTESKTGNILDSPFMQLTFNILVTSFGVWAVPQSISKFYSLKNDRAVVQGTVVSTLFSLLIGCGAYLNGSFVNLFSGITDPSTAIPDMFISSGMGYWLFGIIGILVLSASMSTLSSLAMVGSSSISVDLVKGYLKKDATDSQIKLLMRILCFVFVLISAVLAIFQLDIVVNLMSISWGALAGCFIGPYIYGLYLKKSNKYGAYASIITGLAIMIGIVAGMGSQYSAFGGAVAMLTSMIVTPVVSIVSDKIIKIKTPMPIEKD